MDKINVSKLIYCAVSTGHIQNFNLETTDNVDKMRKFHNFIKLKLILQAKQLVDGSTLLDIAVGRGGDLFKWKEAGFKIIIGFDPHKESLQEAQNRLKEQLSQKKKIPFTKYFHLNALDRSVSSKLEKLEQNIRGLRNDGINYTYDVISCQFAFHYFAKEQSDLNHILNFISSKLNIGGVFIGTATDGDIINNILKNGDVNLKLLQLKRVDSSTYSFNIASKSANKTYFDVKGASLEHYLYKQQFIETAKDYGLTLVNINSFYKWYQEYDKPLSIQEQLISFLNFSFIFRKTS
jgi:mRNA (guanine-N7-)-methyltransferase